MLVRMALMLLGKQMYLDTVACERGSEIIGKKKLRVT